MSKFEKLSNRLYMTEFQNEDVEKCPICLSENIANHFCNECKYNFSELFSCPLLDETMLNEGRKTCVISKMECKKKGLEFEQCSDYHTYGN